MKYVPGLKMVMRRIRTLTARQAGTWYASGATQAGYLCVVANKRFFLAMINSMTIFIASDHAGFELKQKLIDFLREQGKDIEDCGPSIYSEGDDYTDTIAPLAQKVAQNKGSLGIAIGGSGQGEAMVCNRVLGVRAAVFYGGDIAVVPTARTHNDANVLSLGARFLSVEDAQQAVELFLSTPFSNEERHVRRIAKLGL
jgi:ribose 5-phosphate isomerase B